MKDDTISRQAALDIYDDYNVDVENGELEAYGKHRKRILALPSAQPEHLHIVMEKLNKQYEKAINNPFVIKPMAWALYQVWKEYDR